MQLFQEQVKLTVNGGAVRNSRALVVLAVGALDFGLEQAIVAPALPAIQRDYHASTSSVAWLLTGFLIAAAVITPLAGRLGDNFGRRRVLLASLGCFALGSLVCALGGSVQVLIIGRVAQGLGAGMAPLALALAREHIDPARVPTAVGMLVASASIGTVAGLLLAGLLVDHVGVAAIFWLLFAVAVCWRWPCGWRCASPTIGASVPSTSRERRCSRAAWGA